MTQTRSKPLLVSALALCGSVTATMAMAQAEVVVPPPPSPVSTNTATAATPEPDCAPKLPKEITLGSYNSANLAAMVEDVEDLCSGRPLAPADAETVQRRHDAATAAGPVPSGTNQTPGGMR